MTKPDLKFVKTATLEIAYEESGAPNGRSVILLHGFPYDPRGYDAVVPYLLAKGLRVLVPYLRGYGATRFLDSATPRSGQQAALAQDLVEFMIALQIDQADLAGFDWGGRAACIVAALYPERVASLVTGTGYNIQDIAASVRPAPPELEHALWYQYYFHTERGRSGLTENRAGLCHLLWRLWSPSWPFDAATYEATAISFDNPDFVEVVIQSYRHRYGYAAGDPALEPLERRLAQAPGISVPSICLHGEDDGVIPVVLSLDHRKQFSAFYDRRTLPDIGHNLPQEAPAAFADAILSLQP